MLLAATCALGVASLVAQIFKHVLDRSSVHGLVPMFNLNGEANIPTWYSAALLLLCAALVALLALVERERVERRAPYWMGLALLLTAASADEAASIHETVGSFLNGGGEGYVFMVPGSILVVAIVVALRPFVAQLPRSTRRGLVLFAGTFLFGALVLELVEALWRGDQLEVGFGLDLLGSAQDIFELLGLVILVDTLLRYAAEQGHVATLSVRP